MPIIPSNWTGLDTVNAIGGSGGLTGYAYAKQLTTTITELDTFIDLIGPCNEPISREVSLDLITGRLKLYWKNLDGTYTQLHRDNLIFNTGYKIVDLTLGQLGLSIKCSEVSELFLVVRWDKDIEFNIYNPPSPPLADNEISINSVINGSLAYQYFNGNIIEYHYELSNWDEMPIKLYTLVGAIPGQPINIVINQGTADRAQFSIIYYLNESDLSIPFTKSGSGEEWNWVISGKTNATLIPESNKFYKILVQDQFYSPGSFAIATGSPNVPTLPVVNIPDPTPTPTVTPIP
jgi:hypothetical protein